MCEIKKKKEILYRIFVKVEYLMRNWVYKNIVVKVVWYVDKYRMLIYSWDIPL